MLDAGVDGLAPGRKRGRVMLHPETVVADLGLTTAARPGWGCWRMAASPANDLVGTESVSAGGRRCARARWRDRSSCLERRRSCCCRWCRRGWPARSWARDGARATSAPARSFATTSSRRRWIWQPAPEHRDGERLYLRSQGELVRERPLAAVARLRVDDCARRGGARGCRSGPDSTWCCSARPAPARRRPRGG